MSTTTLPGAVADLAAGIAGAVHSPGSADYARLATPWNLAVPARPIAVVAAATAEDVAAAVRWAGALGVRVAVRCTGHGATDDLEGALLVHTGRLDELTIDEHGHARVGAGLTWGPVIAAAAERGLAPVAGSAPGVGVVGFLTGGGFGPLSRTFGLGSDHVHAFDVVTGDGVLRRASATEHRSLFRALRGGKGIAGIVTAVEIDLVPLPTLLGGALFYGAADADRVLRAWAGWSTDLPEAATTSAALLRLPPLPHLPEPIAGRPTLAVRFAWAGDPAEGEAVLAPMRAVAQPVFGAVGVMPAAAIGMIHADPEDPMPTAEGGTMLTGLPDEAVSALLEVAGPAADSAQVVVELRRLGGAIRRGQAGGDVFSGRDIALSMTTVGIAAGPGAAAVRAHADAVAAALEPWATDRRVPNFVPSTDPRRILAVYDREALALLGTVIATYDPDGVIADSRPVREAAVLSLR